MGVMVNSETMPGIAPISLYTKYNMLCIEKVPNSIPMSSGMFGKHSHLRP